ncbi:GGDEF domain-containing protein [uncultured Ruminococcus sp.]|uniref:GGDEF domain-containing protein n=1 Tax=uncultured Ruminococcus sp. TaxID=165186 RepID=UPI0025DF09F8|nr:GGDEF domain-containing protein [uncultured Ruminococcus sp.]
MKKLIKVIDVLAMNVVEDSRRQCNKNVTMSVIVCISAGIMLVMNILRHSVAMTVTSVILVSGFAVTGIVAGVFKKARISSAVMALILTAVFTVFPISGGNEGFAVLWLLLIPLFSISLFGMKIGLGMNIYFLTLVIVLFYTPLNEHIRELYTDNFMKRFPVLFIADSATAQFLALSMEYYYKLNRMQVYTDDMTGVYNRKYFIEMIDNAAILKDDLCISVIDVNGLKETNDTLGHAAGDEMISAVPGFARKAFGESTIISRMGGDEFALITYGSPSDIAKKVADMEAFAAANKGELINEVYLSVGIACRSEYKAKTPEELYRMADKFMYDDKTAYYKEKGINRRSR